MTDGIQAEELRALEWIAGIGLSVLGGIIAWVWNMLVAAVKKHSSDIAELEDTVNAHTLEDARTYVNKVDFKDTVSEIKNTNKRIFERIDQIFTKLGSGH